MEAVSNRSNRRACIRLEGYAEARAYVGALLDALQSWNEETPASSYTLFCIASIISELLPSEEDCDLLDRYHRQRQPQEEQENGE